MTITASRVEVRILITGMDIDCPVCGAVIASGVEHVCIVPGRVIYVDHARAEPCPECLGIAGRPGGQCGTCGSQGDAAEVTVQ